MRLEALSRQATHSWYHPSAKYVNVYNGEQRAALRKNNVSSKCIYDVTVKFRDSGVQFSSQKK